jgi:pumilio RNA-binding family
VIECVPTQHITGLLDTFSGNLVSLSHHPFGCRVMQRILEHCSDQARYDSFMGEILKVSPQCMRACLPCESTCCVCAGAASVQLLC